MAVMDFLSNLSDPQAIIPRMYGTNPAMAGPVMAAQPQMPGAPQMPPPEMAQQSGGRKGVKHFLGVLGDALLTGAGGDPIYGPSVERAEIGAQLASYLGADNPGLAAILANNPDAGMALYNALREDKRFDRTAGQDDRRIGVSEGQLDLGRDELGERRRANQAGEGLTQRGQDQSASVQIQIARMRQQEAAAGRAFDAAMAANDHARAKELLGIQQQFQREIKSLEGGGDAGYTETVVETEGTPARNGWFSDTPGTPTTKTVTRTPIAAAGNQVTSEAQYVALPSGATFTGPDGKQYRKP